MGKSYEYTGISESTTISVKAGVELSSMEAKAIKFSDGAVVLPAAGDVPAGIILINQNDIIKKGEDLSIQVKNIGLWVAGSDFKVGDLLATDAEGLCRKATTGQYAYAVALEEAVVKGDIIKIQITHSGYMK